MSWADLFERAEEYRTDPETIRETLAARRNADADVEGTAGKAEGERDA